MVIRAKRFAVQAHGEQQYGTNPYEYHLRMVVQELENHGFNDSEILSIAWLHDVLEDTPVSKEKIAYLFGESIANSVDRLSNRVSREHTYTQISADANAVIVKIADRLANAQESANRAPKLLKRYKDDYPIFRRILFPVSSECAKQMWEKLDSILGD